MPMQAFPFKLLQSMTDIMNLLFVVVYFGTVPHVKSGFKSSCIDLSLLWCDFINTEPQHADGSITTECSCED